MTSRQIEARTLRVFLSIFIRNGLTSNSTSFNEKNSKQQKKSHAHRFVLLFRPEDDLCYVLFLDVGDNDSHQIPLLYSFLQFLSFTIPPTPCSAITNSLA